MTIPLEIEFFNVLLRVLVNKQALSGVQIYKLDSDVCKFKVSVHHSTSRMVVDSLYNLPHDEVSLLLLKSAASYLHELF